MIFVPQFNCFSKVVSTDFCSTIKFKGEYCRWLIALSNKIFVFSGKLLLSVFIIFIPQANLWRIFFISPSSFILLSIITPSYFTLFDSAFFLIVDIQNSCQHLLAAEHNIYFLFTFNWVLARILIYFAMLC